jgi:hypothetical protein
MRDGDDRDPTMPQRPAMPEREAHPGIDAAPADADAIGQGSHCHRGGVKLGEGGGLSPVELHVETRADTSAMRLAGPLRRSLVSNERDGGR